MEGGIPNTSSFSTLNRLSSTSNPLSSSSLVLFGSLRAVVTTGALVQRRTCLANANPIPREAGDINDQGAIVGQV